MINHGFMKQLRSENYRLSDLQCALGISQIKELKILIIRKNTS